MTYSAVWRVLWTVDLPALSGEVTSQLAALRSPAGDRYTLVDVDRTGPLLRYQTALFVYLDKFVSRSDIDSLLAALHAALTATSSGTTL